jgi:histidyl-tRNA synthetase
MLTCENQEEFAMGLELRNVKGTKDYLPEEQQLRSRIRQTLERVFETYGCKPVETPMLQYYDLLASKYGGGAEILKEVYRLKDQGERELALRYDLTIPLAKVIGMNPDMRLPFKRYEIGKVFRDGPIKPGRFREFIQCDVDIIGVSSVIAEAELMTMAFDAFAQLGMDVYIQYNNRKLLSGILHSLDVGEELADDVMLSLDKLEKIGADGVREDLRTRGIDGDAIAKIVAFLTDGREKTLEYLGNAFSSAHVQEGIKELTELNGYLDAAGVLDKVRFNPFLARGLSIYTGTIYEIFLSDGRLAASIGSGGRYDRIIGQFLNDGRTYPAVGISFGLDAILAAWQMKAANGQPEAADLYLIPLGTEQACMAIAHRLRAAGLRVEMELGGRRLKKALAYANKENIPYVLVFGENEAADSKIRLRSMREGTETVVPLAELEEAITKLVKKSAVRSFSVHVEN